MTDLISIGVKVTSDNAAFNASMGKATKRTRKFSEDTKKNFNSVTKSVKRLILSFATLTAATATLKSISDSTALFSKNLKALQAITGASGKDLKFLEDSAKELSRTTLQAGHDVLESMKLIASAKPELLSNVEALKQTTEEVITLAEAAGVDMPTAVQAAITSLNQFGESADQTNRFVNVLAAGSKLGSAEVGEMANALVKSGASARAAGLSFEELNSVLQILAANGIKNEVAGTAVNMMLTKMSTNANSNFNPAIVGLNKSLQNLRSYLDSIEDPTQRAIELKKIFGEEAQKSARIVINEADAIATLTTKITDTNIAMEQANIQAQSYEATLRKLSNASTNLQQSIGNSTSITGALTGITNAMNDASEAIDRYGLALGGLKSITINPIQRIGKDFEESGLGANASWARRFISSNRQRNEGVLQSSIAAAPSGADLLKNEINSMIENGVKPTEKAFTSFIPVLDLTMARFEAASKKLGDGVISRNITDKGSAAFQRILGNVDNTKEKAATKIVRDPNFERSVASIVDQVMKLPSLTSGGQEKFLKQELPKQMSQLAETLRANMRNSSFASGGANGSTFSVVGDGRREDFSEMIGIFQQLQKFVKETTGQETKVNLNIQVEASKDFVTKVTSSQDNRDIINTTIGQLLEETAKADRR